MDTHEVLAKLIYPKLSAQAVFSDLENLKDTGKGISADCPACGSKQHFFCYHDGHFGKCKAGNKCGKSVSWWEHTKVRYGLDKNRDVLLKLAELAGVTLPDQKKEVLAAIASVEETRALVVDIGRKGVTTMPSKFAEYMESRGFEMETLKKANILYMNRESMIKTLYAKGVTKEFLKESGIISAKFGEDYRLLLPHYDEIGKSIVGFIGRLNPGLVPVDGKMPKYKNHTGLNLDVPFCFHQANEQGNHKMLVVEGPLDALLINHKCDIKGTAAIALCGHTPNERALALINGAIPPVVVLALDDDKAGRSGILSLIGKIRKRVFIANEFAGYKDPGELIAAEGAIRFKEVLLSAVPLPVWWFKHHFNSIRELGPSGRVDVIASVAPIYNSLPNDDKQVFLEEARFATLLHEDVIKDVVGR